MAQRRVITGARAAMRKSTAPPTAIARCCAQPAIRMRGGSCAGSVIAWLAAWGCPNRDAVGQLSPAAHRRQRRASRLPPSRPSISRACAGGQRTRLMRARTRRALLSWTNGGKSVRRVARPARRPRRDDDGVGWGSPVAGEPTVPRRGWSLADRVLIADAARDADRPVLVRSHHAAHRVVADRNGRPPPERLRGRSRWRPVSHGSNLRRAGHASTRKSPPEASLPRRPRVRGRRSASPNDGQSAHRGSGRASLQKALGSRFEVLKPLP